MSTNNAIKDDLKNCVYYPDYSDVAYGPRPSDGDIIRTAWLYTQDRALADRLAGNLNADGMEAKVRTLPADPADIAMATYGKQGTPHMARLPVRDQAGYVVEVSGIRATYRLEENYGAYLKAPPEMEKAWARIGQATPKKDAVSTALAGSIYDPLSCSIYFAPNEIGKAEALERALSGDFKVKRDNNAVVIDKEDLTRFESEYGAHLKLAANPNFDKWSVRIANVREELAKGKGGIA